MTTVTTLLDRFAATACDHADVPALEVGREVLTYRGLDDASRRATAHVQRRGSATPRVVALCCGRSVEAYVGYLAVLRLGAAVVPVSPTAPAARVAGMCRDAGVELIVGDADGRHLAEHVARTCSIPAVALQREALRSAPARSGCVGDTSEDDVAYIVFTSGSSGRPKGVPIRHRQLVEYVPSCVERYGVGVGSRLSQTFDLTFDPSVFDLFVAWSAGATVVVPAPEEILSPARFVHHREISHWFSVPSIITIARRLRRLPPDAMPNLRWSLFAGEALTLDQARVWAAAAPTSTIENLYGPTELTITCTSYRLPDDVNDWPATPNGTVPIGRPYAHVEVEVVRDEPAEARGELCARGPQRFGGYLRASDNDGQFVQITDAGMEPVAVGPPVPGNAWYRTGDRVEWHEGELVYIGRRDGQVKVSGHRVELGEVEHAVRSHPDVDETVVVAVEASVAGFRELRAVYSGREVAAGDLAEHVRRRLPDFMVPARFVHVVGLRRNGNGKIDRHAALACAVM